MIVRASIVALVVACGGVAQDAADAPSDTASPPATYRAAMATTSTVRFGGTPYCSYTITLTQISIELAIHDDTGEPSAGTAENLNLEAVVMPCPNEPAPPSIARYTLDEVRPQPPGTQLAFRGDPGNHPGASLVIDLVPETAGYRGQARWNRTDQGPPLAWTVSAMLVFAPVP